MINLDKKLIEDIKNTKDDYARACKLVRLLFKDIKDKEGEPYIGHLLRVSNKLKNENTRIAGFLHDIVEDIPDFTFEDLKELNFNEEIITMVRIVTKNKIKKDTYHDRITSILESNNIEAIKLKYSDISDNYDKKRLNKLDEETKNRLINKYEKEIVRIEKFLKERGENI